MQQDMIESHIEKYDDFLQKNLYSNAYVQYIPMNYNINKKHANVYQYHLYMNNISSQIPIVHVHLFCRVVYHWHGVNRTKAQGCNCEYG